MYLYCFSGSIWSDILVPAFELFSAYYGAVYGMQVVGNWLSCPWHWAPERRKLYHTHYGANICTTEEKHRIMAQVKQRHFMRNLLFHQLMVLTTQVSTVYSKIQRCKRFGGHNFPTWKRKSSVKYCLPSISSHSSYCQELNSVVLLLGERSNAKSWHNGNPLFSKLAMK